MIIFQEIQLTVFLHNLQQYLQETSTSIENTEFYTVDKCYKATVNDILNLLLDNYVNTKFSTRQQAAFNSMYNKQFKLKKSNVYNPMQSTPVYFAFSIHTKNPEEFLLWK